MRIFLFLCAVFLLSSQVALTYVWAETPFLVSFKNTFSSFYNGGIPVWSDMAFSLGQWWYVLSAMLFGLLCFVFFTHKTLSTLFYTTASALLSLASMLYAMYPIHLMAQVSI